LNNMKIVISGLGVMGGSLALAIKRSVENVNICGYDQSEIIFSALEQKIIDQGINQWPDECHDADLIFLCTPLDIIEQHLKELAKVISKNTIVTDVGSTKLRLYNLVRDLDFRGIYVGGHPMTGAEKSGLSASNPVLYENAVYLLTNIEQHDRSLIDSKLIHILDLLKARVMLLDAGIHDKIMAAISHVPQLMAISLVNLIGELSKDENPYFELAAGGFRDMTRIGSSSFNVWKEIIASNRENIEEVLQQLIKILQSQKMRLKDLSGDFSSSNNYRSRVPKIGKGFLTPMTDVLVYVKDEVGVVAKISTALVKQNIDIRDIELLKIREKEGGVFRLSFESYQKAELAVEVLKSIDYQAFIKE